MNSLKYIGYANDAMLWRKWRLTFEGGDAFINAYLKRFSSREDQTDFNARLAMTYCPSFAKEAIVDIRNSIVQRMVEVQRVGPESYLEAMNTDVDGYGTNMTQFMGSNVLDDLLIMRRVGIWIDKGDDEPYVYMYQVEDILNWDDEGNPTNILLRDYEPAYNELGLMSKPKETLRHAKVVDGHVEVQFLNPQKEKIGEVEFLDFDSLPFVMLEIQESLLKDIANYQIALLNVASSDLSYVLRANFPFYTEQYDARADMMHKFSAVQPPAAEGDVIQESTGKSESVGVTNGKRYPLGVDRPGFISPPVEPLAASMAKQEQLKQEIRVLVNLSLSNMSPTRASRESKEQDEKGLEAGLARLGQELEKAERRIAYFWGKYIGAKEPLTVSYPKDYSLKSDAERQAEADADLALIDKLPSLTAKKETLKKVITTLFGGRLTAAKVTAILQEVDALTVVVSSPEVLYADLENHLVSNATASELRGYASDESLKAILDHTDKLARIAIAQSEAAIINSNTPGTPTVKTEKEKKNDDT